jgi:hypothetical protein
VCDEDGNVGLILARVEVERIVEDRDVDDSTMLSRRLLERRTAGTEEYELHLRHHAAGPVCSVSWPGD